MTPAPDIAAIEARAKRLAEIVEQMEKPQLLGDYLELRDEREILEKELLEKYPALLSRVRELEEAMRWRDADELPAKLETSKDSRLCVVEMQHPYAIATAWYEYDTRLWVSSEMGVGIDVIKWRYAK